MLAGERVGTVEAASAATRAALEALTAHILAAQQWHDDQDSQADGLHDGEGPMSCQSLYTQGSRMVTGLACACSQLSAAVHNLKRDPNPTSAVQDLCRDAETLIVEADQAMETAQSMAATLLQSLVQHAARSSQAGAVPEVRGPAQPAVPQIDLSDTTAAIQSVHKQASENGVYTAQTAAALKELEQELGSSVAEQRAALQRLESEGSEERQNILKSIDQARSDLQSSVGDLERELARVAELATAAWNREPTTSASVAPEPTPLQQPSVPELKQPAPEEDKGHQLAEVEQELRHLNTSVAALQQRLGTLAPRTALFNVSEDVRKVKESLQQLCSLEEVRGLTSRVDALEARPEAPCMEDLEGMFVSKPEEDRALEAAFKRLLQEQFPDAGISLSAHEEVALGQGEARLPSVRRSASTSRGGSRPRTAQEEQNAKHSAMPNPEVSQAPVALHASVQGAPQQHQHQPSQPTQAASSLIEALPDSLSRSKAKGSVDAAVQSAAAFLAKSMQREVEVVQDVERATAPLTDGAEHPPPTQPLTPAEFLNAQPPLPPSRGASTLLLEKTGHAADKARRAAQTVCRSIKNIPAVALAKACRRFGRAMTSEVSELLEIAGLRQDETDDAMSRKVEVAEHRDEPEAATSLGRVKCVACDRPTRAMPGPAFPRPLPDELTRKQRAASLTQDAGWLRTAGDLPGLISGPGASSKGGGFRNDPSPYIMQGSLPGEQLPGPQSSDSAELVQRYKTAVALRGGRLMPLGVGAAGSAATSGKMPPGPIRRMSTAPGQLGMTASQASSALKHGWEPRVQGVTVAAGVKPGVGGYRPLMPEDAPEGNGDSERSEAQPTRVEGGGTPGPVLLVAHGDAARQAEAAMQPHRTKGPEQRVATEVARANPLAEASGWSVDH